MSPLLVLIIAVLATTYAGPIVRFAAAPAIAIAFWRLALVLPVTGGLAVGEGSREQGAGSRTSHLTLLPAPRSLRPLMTLSGVLLALDRIAPLHHRRQLSRAGVAQAGVRVGYRGAVAAGASQPHRGVGHRARGAGREPDRTGGRAAVARRAGRGRAGPRRRRDGRGLLRHR